MADTEHLIMLETHRANLSEAKTFEEYRDHHIAYVDTLIERQKAMIAKDAATVKFIYRSVTTEETSDLKETT